MRPELDRRESRARGAAGARRAMRAARRVDPDWEKRAMHHFLREAKRLRNFMTEEIRAALPRNFPKPPDARAWGGIVRAAVRAGLIEPCGYARQASRTCHGSPKTIWRWVGF